MSTEKPLNMVAIMEFVLSGDAVFTLVSKGTKKRFTYQIRRKIDQNIKKERPIFWVNLLTGPDNRSNYTQLGRLTTDGGDYLVYKVKGGLTSGPRKGIQWLVDRITDEDYWRFTACVDFLPEGRCRACGRRLTDPHSIVAGIGPECAKRN